MQQESEIRKFVSDFKGLINQQIIAKELNISNALLGYIIRGQRTDHYQALEYCKQKIEEKLKGIMPQS